jgi:hypothetical protein
MVPHHPYSVAVKNYNGKNNFPIIIIKNDDGVEISNHSLRLDALHKPIRYALKWTINSIQLSETVSLKAKETHHIDKSDWRKLGKEGAITDNLKLSIQAQDITEEFLLGPSKNISELKSISFQKTEGGMKILFQIIDMDFAVSTIEHCFKLGFEESIQEIGEKMNKGFEEIPKVGRNFEDSIFELEIDSDLDKDYTRFMSFTTNRNKHLRNGERGFGLEVTHDYRPTFHQEQVAPEVLENKLLFSVVNCKENGDKQKCENEINLCFSDDNKANDAVKEFNDRSEHFLIERPKKEKWLSRNEVKILGKRGREKFAFDIDYLFEKEVSVDLPISGFIPHLTLLEEKLRPVEIRTAKFDYDGGKFPKYLDFVVLMAHPFNNVKKCRNFSLPYRNSKKKNLSFAKSIFRLINGGDENWRWDLARNLDSKWAKYEIFKEKSTFENAPFIPIKLDHLIEEYTGKKTGRIYHFDIFKGTVGYLCKNGSLEEIEDIQMWMVRKEEDLDTDCFEKYFSLDKFDDVDELWWTE